MKIAHDLLDSPVTAHKPFGKNFERYPALIAKAIHDQLTFRPAPPGNERAPKPAQLPEKTVAVPFREDELKTLLSALKRGALRKAEVEDALKFAHSGPAISKQIRDAVGDPPADTWVAGLDTDHELSRLSLLAVSIIDRLQQSMLDIEPFTTVHFRLDERTKAALAVGWEATVKRGQFPLRPHGARRFIRLQENPCGGLHFVSASDLDDGYYYTLGIAQSPEAQALRTMDASFGLDGELIVPGQAVSPIPPFLAMATRLFAASIPTSSNISEEVQSIPMRNFPHPAAVDDLAPIRGGILKPTTQPGSPEELVTDLRLQLARNRQQSGNRKASIAKVEGSEEFALPPIGAVFEVTGLTRRQIKNVLTTAFRYDPELGKQRQLIALYLNIEPTGRDRVAEINKVVAAAADLGLRYVAVADDAEDSWLPNLLEYLEADELNDVADFADAKGVIVTDGRPVDPVYTAATAAQRIQSVYTTLSVDILKMGMWLCLDALTARKVWREILSNPHIPRSMLLMPIGIVEPWSAFCDNRNPEKTPRAILDPYEKIKFMIEEAECLKMPSLLTDTRHKATWVLLGRRTAKDKPHLREKFVYDPGTGEIIGRTSDSARPLLSWDEFMDCERRARKAGILLGQAGSVEVEELFQIISETTYDAAKDGQNPATAIWTAETERVLRTRGGQETRDLQAQRSAAVSPFLAVFNRGVESHAKLDGWLRYLGELGFSDPLRDKLNEQRERVSTLLGNCVAVQGSASGEYQSAFDDFRAAYVDYHHMIRDNYDSVRQKVAASWRKYAVQTAR